MASLRVPPPTIEEMLSDVARWMALHLMAKVTVRIDYRNGDYDVTEHDYRCLPKKGGDK